MIFGAVAVAAARGAVLAHSVDAGGARLRKGKVLDADDIARLAAAGMGTVVVARLEAGDIGEDVAAGQIGAALAGAGLRSGAAATGRVNLVAEGPGVIGVDAEAVAAVNAVDAMITLATLPHLQRVAAGDMVATVKIIAYGVAAAAATRATASARGALRLWPPVLRTACLIETVTGPLRTPSAKGRAATETRLARLGVALAPRVIVAHETGAVAEAIGAAGADLVLVLTASATSDVADVGPGALAAAGGRVARFGMPVDPGNLLFLGDLRGRPVIGLPGCARSPALNGADWVIERMICGVPVGPQDIAGMGVGGLLKEVAARGRPRDM